MAGDTIKVTRGQTKRLQLRLFQAGVDGPPLDLTGGKLEWERYTLPTNISITLTDSAQGIASLVLAPVDTTAMESRKEYPVQIRCVLPGDTIIFPAFILVAK